MNLAQYLAKPGRTASALAAQVGCSVSTITRAANGITVPEHRLMVKIFHATDERVRPESFYQLGSPS